MCKTAGLVFICTAELTVHGILLAQRAIMIPVKSQNPVCNLDDLRTIQALDGIDDWRLEALREHLCLVEHEQDDVILHQGEATEALYSLLSGQVTVILKEEDGKQHSLAELTPDDTFGERALLTGELRTTEVIANASV
jgi:CRP-like cAMP-binding protein